MVIAILNISKLACSVATNYDAVASFIVAVRRTKTLAQAASTQKASAGL
jgi:hypothetical protein